MQYRREYRLTIHFDPVFIKAGLPTRPATHVQEHVGVTDSKRQNYMDVYGAERGGPENYGSQRPALTEKRKFNATQISKWALASALVRNLFFAVFQRSRRWTSKSNPFTLGVFSCRRGCEAKGCSIPCLNHDSCKNRRNIPQYTKRTEYKIMRDSVQGFYGSLTPHFLMFFSLFSFLFIISPQIAGVMWHQLFLVERYSSWKEARPGDLETNCLPKSSFQGSSSSHKVREYDSVHRSLIL
ncbi:hypothetical protein BDV29DRAFT_113219 [Aspergillus leporis]|uniref:Uncharacterized protein n=1 Tax=Aspergillus leporis TaxID=41062 RepID=A0A5N5X2X8_9EURO|nr:hypothetical protein BDV29DRAFT_113219 [Aspergillus leporis]